MKKNTAIIAIIALCLCLILTACNEDFNNPLLEKLETPNVVEIVNDYVYWKEVPNASSYVIQINDIQQNAGNSLKYSIASIMDNRLEADIPTELHIYVKARGNQLTNSDSDWSAEKVYIYTKSDSSTNEEPSNNDNTSIGNNSSTQTNTTYFESGVGHTIDVVTATSYNNFKVGVDVLDLKNADYKQKENKENDSSNNSYKSIEEVYNNCSLSFEIACAASSDKIMGFVRNYNINFKASTAIDYENIKDSYYFILDHYINRYTLSLSNFSEEGYYIEYLSRGYLASLDKLAENPTKESFYDFFNKYGTHLIASGIFGGRLNAYYTVVDKTSKFSNETRAFLTATILDATTQNSVSTTTEIKNYFEQNSHEIEANFKLTNYGGNSVGAFSIDDFGNAYSDWIDSFNKDSSNSVLIGYENDGLIALWDLLPSKYQYLKNTMIDAFTKYYEDYYSGYVKEFSYNNTIDYAGGSGTPSDPYLIENAVQLKNIELNLDSSFEIIKDIDLSGYADWNAIGGHYKVDKTMFVGLLEGNNHTISNLKRTTDIAEKNNRIYFGLFGRIGTDGIVRNLVFENINVESKGPKVNNSSTKVFFGIIAGALYGKVDNITIKSGSFSYNCCTNGASFVGSIVGTAINCEISNCINNINLTSGRYGGIVGGIAGFAASAKFKNCVNNGTLKSYCTSWGGSAYAGGIVGERTSTRECTYYQCTNNGTLSTNAYDPFTLIPWYSGKGNLEAHTISGCWE